MISDLQHEAYPLIAPKNESFPDMYITTRHDLFTQIFNRTISNATVQLINPLKGTWFAMVNLILTSLGYKIHLFQGLIERLSTDSKSKVCKSSLDLVSE
jgi:hypothetical protein